MRRLIYVSLASAALQLLQELRLDVLLVLPLLILQWLLLLLLGWLFLTTTMGNLYYLLEDVGGHIAVDEVLQEIRNRRVGHRGETQRETNAARSRAGPLFIARVCERRTFGTQFGEFYN